MQMKIKIQQVPEGQEEIILRYYKMTEEIQEILHFLKQKDNTLLVKKDGQQIVIQPGQVIYLESVEGVTYVYTRKDIYASNISLATAGELFSSQGFFRCSKSMVLNIYHIERLKSEPGNRIDAQMKNGEHVIISRRYAKELRRILKGGVR